MRGATVNPDDILNQLKYFNPHSPCGERPVGTAEVRQLLLFQSTLPMRGATLAVSIFGFMLKVFQSTLPMRGATSTRNGYFARKKNFNPHSPCGERLQRPRHRNIDTKNFNPHSPCGERRFCREGKKRCSYFNPHSPCGERLLCVVHLFLKWIISIHTPHAGSDAEPCPECGSIDYISIHTPHAGSDPCTIHSRPKRGAFQSTLPMRGATSFFMCNVSGVEHFNPHSPCGERPTRLLNCE